MIKDSPEAPDRLRLSPRVVFTVGTLVTLALVGLVYLYVPSPPPASSVTPVQSYGAFENRDSSDKPQNTEPVAANSTDGPAMPGAEVDAAAADRSPPGLYATYCAQCHGRSGDGGDAPLARMMANKPPNLVRGPFRFGRDVPSVVQLIRNGVGSMPGFAEEMTESEAAALAAHVLALEKGPNEAQPEAP